VCVVDVDVVCQDSSGQEEGEGGGGRRGRHGQRKEGRKETRNEEIEPEASLPINLTMLAD